MKLEIYRTKSNDKQTIGESFIVGGDIALDQQLSLFKGYTLELPDKDNQPYISRIPAGIYQCKKRWSWGIKNHFHILGVPNRTWILIHAGNYYTDIKGCVLVGSDLKDINDDGLKDVINSKKTLNKMLELLPERFELEIFDEED